VEADEAGAAQAHQYPVYMHRRQPGGRELPLRSAELLQHQVGEPGITCADPDRKGPGL
jgi:hypothetical protein